MKVRIEELLSIAEQYILDKKKKQYLISLTRSDSLYIIIYFAMVEKKIKRKERKIK